MLLIIYDFFNGSYFLINVSFEITIYKRTMIKLKS